MESTLTAEEEQDARAGDFDCFIAAANLSTLNPQPSTEQ